MTSFHRTAGSSPLGKCDATLKTSVPEDTKIDFERLARDRGFGSSAEMLREMVLMVTYGESMVRTLYERRMSAMSVIGTEKGQS